MEVLLQLLSELTPLRTARPERTTVSVPQRPSLRLNEHCHQGIRGEDPAEIPPNKVRVKPLNSLPGQLEPVVPQELVQGLGLSDRDCDGAPGLNKGGVLGKGDGRLEGRHRLRRPGPDEGYGGAQGDGKNQDEGSQSPGQRRERTVLG